MKYKFGSKVVELKEETIFNITDYFDSEFSDLKVFDEESNCIFKFFSKISQYEGNQRDLISIAHFLVCFYQEREKLIIEIYPDLSRRMKMGNYLPESLQKLFATKCNNVSNRIYQSFLYNVFLSFLQIILLQDGESLFHSSAVETKDGNAVLIGGYGGVGKSSTASLLCKSMSAKFLTDDICIVNRTGKVNGNPMPLHIYPYNIQDVLSSGVNIWKSNFDKYHWYLRQNLNKKVCRRISLDKLYDTVSEWNSYRNISLILIIKRVKTETSYFDTYSNSQFAEFMNSVMEIELSSLHKHLIDKSFSFNDEEVKIKDLLAKQRSIFYELSKNVKVLKYCVPKDKNITSVNDFLLSNFQKVKS